MFPPPSRKSSCVNCFSKSCLDLSQSGPSSSLGKKKARKSSSLRSSPSRASQDSSNKASSKKAAAAGRRRRPEEPSHYYLSRSQFLGWQLLSSRDRVVPAAGPEEEHGPAIEEYYGQTLYYHSASAFQKGGCFNCSYRYIDDQAVDTSVFAPSFRCLNSQLSQACTRNSVAIFFAFLLEDDIDDKKELGIVTQIDYFDMVNPWMQVAPEAPASPRPLLHPRP